MKASRLNRQRTAGVAALLGIALAATAAAPASAAGYKYYGLANPFYVYACKSGLTTKIKVVPVASFPDYEIRVTEAATYGSTTSAWTTHSSAVPVYVSLGTTPNDLGVYVTITQRSKADPTRVGSVSISVKKAYTATC